MNILTTYFTANRLFTFVREGMMYIEFNSVTLFTVLYSRFLNCAKDVSKVTAQPTILELKVNVNIQTVFKWSKSITDILHYIQCKKRFST